MKNYILLGCFTIIFSFHLKAQTAKINELKKMSIEQKATWFSDTLKNILKLDNAQYSKVYNIAFTTAKNAQPIINSTNSRYSKALNLKPLFKEAEEKIKAVLTASQLAIYDSAKQEMIAYIKQQRKTLVAE
jgi:hypothetical protein